MHFAYLWSSAIPSGYVYCCSLSYNRSHSLKPIVLMVFPLGDELESSMTHLEKDGYEEKYSKKKCFFNKKKRKNHALQMVGYSSVTMMALTLFHSLGFHFVEKELYNFTRESFLFKSLNNVIRTNFSTECHGFLTQPQKSFSKYKEENHCQKSFFKQESLRSQALKKRTSKDWFEKNDIGRKLWSLVAFCIGLFLLLFSQFTQISIRLKNIYEIGNVLSQLFLKCLLWYVVLFFASVLKRTPDYLYF